MIGGVVGLGAGWNVQPLTTMATAMTTAVKILATFISASIELGSLLSSWFSVYLAIFLFGEVVWNLLDSYVTSVFATSMGKAGSDWD